MRASFLLAFILPLCSAAPTPFDAKHKHDGNDTRDNKIFENSEIHMGDLTVDTATGDNMQIGHTLDINVVQNHGVHSAKENADYSNGNAAPTQSHDGDFEERLRRLFKSMDTDEDGIISVTELIRICNENDIYITELEAENVLTYPSEAVPFTLSYFLAILENAASSSDTGDLIHFLLRSSGSQDHLMFDKNLMHVFLALDADHDCLLFVPDILAVFQDLGRPNRRVKPYGITLDEAKSLLSGYHGHNHHDGVDFALWKKLILGEVFKQDEHLVNFWRDVFIETKKSFNTGKGVVPVEGEGKPLCKGRNFPDGQECCEPEDPEGSQCVEGQGDCDSDEGCSGDLVCGSDNCMKYNPMADPEDDCCMPKHVGDVMRTNIENAAKTAVKVLKHGPEFGECYQGELVKVEGANVEVKEGLLYKLQLRISTMGGEDCMESREMICENILMTKPLPKECRGTEALKLLNREHITCQLVGSTTTSSTTTSKEFPEIAAAFSAMDTDGDGKITRDQFKQFMLYVDKDNSDVSEDVLNRIWQMADTGGDGMVSLEEFINFAEKGSDKEGAFNTFVKAFDKDGSGALNVAEYTEFDEQIMGGQSRGMVGLVVEMMDQDGDGEINAKELEAIPSPSVSTTPSPPVSSTAYLTQAYPTTAYPTTAYPTNTYPLDSKDVAWSTTVAPSLTTSAYDSCNNLIEKTATSSHDFIESENFGTGSYPPNRMDCWRIIWPQGKQLSLNFDPLFRLEGDTGCPYDYLHMYSANSLHFYNQKFCGVIAPTDLVVNSNTHSNALLVKFATDGDNTIGCEGTCYGFRMNFVTVDDPLWRETTVAPPETTDASPEPTNAASLPGSTTAAPTTAAYPTTPYPLYSKDWRSTEKHWSGAECPNLSVDTTSLEECKKNCEDLKTCTAINYVPSTSKCVLKACEIPVPAPQTYDADYKGYFLLDYLH